MVCDAPFPLPLTRGAFAIKTIRARPIKTPALQAIHEQVLFSFKIPDNYWP